MISRFFIDRPIFAAVLSIVITLAGGVSLLTLPLAQFPPISPPTVSVTCTYPGASAKEVADSVAAPIEQQVNGVENMMYMSSQSANDGTYNLTVTFRPGVNLNLAQVLVQNRVSLAVPSLPDVIKQTGVTVLKRSPDILMGVALISPDNRYDHLYLSNYALIQIKDELVRVPGIGDVFLFGQRDYSMRVWVNPDQLATRKMTAGDVVAAIREQNLQVATGAIGQEPSAGNQATQVTLSTVGRLQAVEDFSNIVLKTSSEGRTVRLGDVARLELGPKNSDTRSRCHGRDAVFLAIFQRPDANALDVYQRTLAKLEELKKNFPEGVTYEIGFDTTPYTRESINEVVKTLRDAIILVAAVVLLFLQNWRSAVIPLIAVPVAIIGTFAAMAAFGFSLNNLTLFGLILSIGIVVDDAIVVVEAVEHHIEHGLAPREASIAAMRQVTGPVIAVGLVLSAVFVPCFFISGITGAFFRQFALTIAVSTILSVFNSLTLSPALTALLLRPRQKVAAPPLPWLLFPLIGAWLGWEFLAPWLGTVGGVVAGAVAIWVLCRPINFLLRHAFALFHRSFTSATAGYTRAVGGLLHVTVFVLLLYVGLLGLTGMEYMMTPRGFIPAQDMGLLLVSVQLPDSASVERTDKVMRHVEKIAMETPGIAKVNGIVGQSFVLGANASNFGSLFVNLNEYPQRRDPKLSSDAVANELRRRFAAEIPEAIVAVFGPSPVRGVGRAGGFALMIEDRGDLGPAALQKQTENFIFRGNQLKIKEGSQVKGIGAMFSIFRANVPQLHIKPDFNACMMRGVRLQDFADTLSVYEGSLYVNDFNRFGRTWQVIVQADEDFRRKPEDIPLLKTRNIRGALVPIGSLAQPEEVNGPLVLTRYNMYVAAAVNGNALPGTSSGAVIDLLEPLADRELPQTMAYEWTDMSYLELQAGNTGMVIFLFAVAMVFLFLAAQYESWSLPLAVILVVPMCLLSAILGVNLAHMDINIFTQIGFVVLVGLASKNAILIVEFARQLHHDGQSRRAAAMEACRLRLRPIIMTSLAFILGVLPLMMSVGAGAEMRRALGTAVFSGMIGVTLFGIFLTPVFFYVIEGVSESPLFHSNTVQWAIRIGLFLLFLVGVPCGLMILNAERLPSVLDLISGFVAASVLLFAQMGAPHIGRLAWKLMRRPNRLPPLSKNGDQNS